VLKNVGDASGDCLSPAILFRAALATALLAIFEDIGAFPTGTLVIHHSQNVTIPISLSQILTASTQFKADFYLNNMS
jgi:hypothetical protein